MREERDGGPIVTDEFDPRNVEPSVAVVDVVAEVKETTPRSLDPLHTVIDSSELDRMFAEAGKEPLEVTFTYEGFTVSVRRGGEIVLRHADRGDQSES